MVTTDACMTFVLEETIELDCRHAGTRRYYADGEDGLDSCTSIYECYIGHAVSSIHKLHHTPPSTIYTFPSQKLTTAHFPLQAHFLHVPPLP